MAFAFINFCHRTGIHIYSMNCLLRAVYLRSCTRSTGLVTSLRTMEGSVCFYKRLKDHSGFIISRLSVSQQRKNRVNRVSLHILTRREKQKSSRMALASYFKINHLKRKYVTIRKFAMIGTICWCLDFNIDVVRGLNHGVLSVTYFALSWFVLVFEGRHRTFMDHILTLRFGINVFWSLRFFRPRCRFTLKMNKGTGVCNGLLIRYYVLGLVL